MMCPVGSVTVSRAIPLLPIKIWTVFPKGVGALLLEKDCRYVEFSLDVDVLLKAKMAAATASLEEISTVGSSRNVANCCGVKKFFLFTYFPQPLPSGT
jgi:hypothetical protein